jgi:tetratricopeptide (TPR) repeat protein
MDDDGDSPDAKRGAIFFDQGRYPDAEKYFRQALAQEPHDLSSLSRLAVCELNQQRAPQAYETIQRALALAPESAHLHALKGFIEVELRRPADALKSAETALELDPESDDAFVARAAAYSHQREWAKAEAAARAALELNPEHPGAANQLAHVLRLQNRLHESGDQVAYMLAQNPEDADTHVAAGWTALQRGERDQAESHFLEALRLDAGNEAAREGLKESFRAKSPVYRAYLNYCFFMARFTEGKQWLIIIGLLVIVRVARATMGGYGLIVAALYMLFVLWVHVARPVGNFQLLLDRAARHALDGREKIEAVLSGGGVLAGLLLLIGSLLAGSHFMLISGATLIGAAFPFAYTFTNVTHGKWLFGAIGLFVLVTGATKLIPGMEAMAAQFTSVAFLAVIATTWICGIDSISRRA